MNPLRRASGGPDLGRIGALVGSDPGGRGLARIRHVNDLGGFATALLRARRVGLVTGFVHLGTGRAETDGPPGTAAVGRALVTLGREVCYLTDGVGAPLLEALGARPLRTPRLGPAAGRAEAARRLLDELGCEALVAIERPGRTPDGTYRNLRGRDISAATEPLDELFLVAGSREVATFAIGDGGNELGMGALSIDDRRALAGDVANAAVVGADHLLVAGVSNWGAYGVVAALGVLTGMPLLPSAAELRRDLEVALAAGAVDGITGLAEPTVDGLPYSATLDLVAAMAGA